MDNPIKMDELGVHTPISGVPPIYSYFCHSSYNIGTFAKLFKRLGQSSVALSSSAWGSLEQPKIRPELRQLAKVVEPEATEVLEFLSLGHWPVDSMGGMAYFDGKALENIGESENPVKK